MVFAAPKYESRQQEVERATDAVFRGAGFIRRWAKEIDAADLVDMQRLYKLISDCQAWKLEAERWRSGSTGDFSDVLDGLSMRMKGGGMGNPDLTKAETNSALRELHGAITDFLSAVAPLVPKEGQSIPNATVIVNRNPPNLDLVVTVPKTPAVVAAVKSLLSVLPA